MSIKKKKFQAGAISTASMPDIIFMLLIFFMVTTVIREYRGLPVRIPEAENSQKIEGKRNFTHCFVDMNERISVDDKLLTPKELVPILYLKRSQNPRVVVMLKIDESTKNGIVDKVHKSLQEADARRIVYASKTK